MQIKENYFLNKKVLVAGGTGFVGQHFVKQLSKKNTEVYASTLITFKQDRFDLPENVHYLHADLLQEEDCERATKGMDLVIMCAASSFGAKVMNDNPSVLIRPNFLMHLNMLEACRKNGVKQFMMMSSSAIYPERDHALKEEEGFVEDPPPIYFGVGWMKRSVEKLCQFYERTYQMQCPMIRPVQLYGPGMDWHPETSHMIPSLIYRALRGENPLMVWGQPSVARDYMYIEDFVSTALKIIEARVSDPINVGTQSLIPTSSVVDLITKHTARFLFQRKPEIQFDATKPTTVHIRQVDSSKAKKYYPDLFTSFDQGIKWTVDDIYKGMHRDD